MAATLNPIGTTPGDPVWMRNTADLARKWSAHTERDVRQLVGYLRDLKAHDWAALIAGADDWPRFCREVLGHDPAFLAEMEDGVGVLEGAGHKGPISEKQAKTAAQRTQEAARRTTGEVLPRGRQPESNPEFKDLTQAERARQNGVSLAQQERLDALARKAPNLHERVQTGELSCHAACIAAGIVRVPTPLDILRRAWARASEDERAQFLKEVSPEATG